jgi:hypothetical protein
MMVSGIDKEQCVRYSIERESKMKPRTISKKQQKKTAPKRPARKVAKPGKSKPKARLITGNVSQIFGGRQTSKTLSAEQAFSDSEQAAAQVEWAEANGTKEMIRLTRLAYRQYQGKRYRRA